MEVQDWVRVGVVALLGVPSGWLAAVLIDRIPEEHPLFRPFPGAPFVAGLTRRTGLLVYLVTALAFGLTAARFESTRILVPYLVFVLGAVALSVIDLRTLRLPNRLVFPLLGAGVVLLGLVELSLDRPQHLTQAAAGAVFYFGFLGVAALVYPAGMGLGDVKASLVLGLYVGFLGSDTAEALALVLYAMLIGFALGSIAGIGVLVARRRSEAYPFGPFLFAGAFAVILLSDRILDGA